MELRRLSFAITLTAGIAAFASPALADIVFELGNHPQPDEENILFQAPQTGASITGATNQTNVPVFFSSLTGQDLLQQAQGQADILQNVTNPAQNSALTSMDINLCGPNTGGQSVSCGLGFLDFIMNPLNGSGTATVTVFDNIGGTFTYDLGNGNNFLTITAINGQFITDVQLTVEGGSFIEFKQPRISGVGFVPAPVVGAGLPGLVMACGGLLALARRRRQKIA